KISVVDREGRAIVTTQDQTGAQVKVMLEVGITGAAKNTSSTAFVMHDSAGCAAAKLLFSSETGKIWAVNPDVNARTGMVVVDRSSVGASYKGLAIIDLSQIQPGQGSGSGSGSGTKLTGLRIIAPDFHNARIDVFDENFNLISQTNPSAGSGSGSGSGSALQTMFVNPNLPAGYAPFNTVVLNGAVYVTYAKQDAAKADDVKGAGLGMVDEFDLQGNFMRTIVDVGGLLDAPWGVALAPANFCSSTANKLLIGNFGDGHIIAVEPDSGRVLGMLSDDKGNSLAIEGLWSLRFEDQAQTGQGSGSGSGASTQARLYFSSGPGDEKHGLFGYLVSTSEPSK
ncbi:MAG: TIGR03118 family protein, partial [Acidobacteriota bacterium]